MYLMSTNGSLWLGQVPGTELIYLNDAGLSYLSVSVMSGSSQDQFN